MKGRAVLVIAAAVATTFAMPQPKFAVQACPDTNSCAEVTIGGGNVDAGQTISIPVTFRQGADNGQAGGIDEIAALAFTLSIASDGNGTPLTLADCTLNADGLPNAVVPDQALSNFKVVVENASCAGGRTHCLCPDAGSGISPDNFINVVVYGPNPLPTPGPTGIDIPTLPSGQLMTIGLKAGASAGGTIPLHVYNEVTDTTHPQFTAFLSVGDKLAVDQTCVPVTGQPPCSSDTDVSQVAITDGSVMIKPVGIACVGDCDGGGSVTVNEIITMVNIALGTASVDGCLAGDADGSGTITINEIITAVGNVLNGCPQAGAAGRR